MIPKLRSSLVGTIAAWMLGSAAIGSELTLAARTYRYHPPGTQEARYEPLGYVEIRMNRDGEKTFLGRSKEDGRFSTPIPAGSPFTLVFEFKGHVPEVQQLAGPAGTTNRVHVSLYTVRDYLLLFGEKGSRRIQSRIEILKDLGFPEVAERLAGELQATR